MVTLLHTLGVVLFLSAFSDEFSDFLMLWGIGCFLLALKVKEWERDAEEQKEERAASVEKQMRRMREYQDAHKAHLKLEREQRENDRQRREEEKRVELLKLEGWLKLSGYAFEQEFAKLLTRNGWKASETRRSGDGGIDIEARDPDGRTVAIECKRWSEDSKIGREILQKLYGAGLNKYDRLAVITTAGYSANAKEYASASGIELWDRRHLLDFIESGDSADIDHTADNDFQLELQDIHRSDTVGTPAGNPLDDRTAATTAPSPAEAALSLPEPSLSTSERAEADLPQETETPKERRPWDANSNRDKRARARISSGSGWKAGRRRAVRMLEEVTGKPATDGFKSLHFHDLRHTFGSHLMAAEVSYDVRRQILGHKDGDITAHYCKVPTTQLIDAIKRLEPPKLPQNSRNGNVLAFPNVSEVRKVLKNKGEVVATGGLEPPTPAL